MIDQGPRFCAHGVAMVLDPIEGWRSSRNCMACLGEKLDGETRAIERLLREFGIACVLVCVGASVLAGCACPAWEPQPSRWAQVRTELLCPYDDDDVNGG